MLRGDLLVTAVVEPGGARVGVAGQALHVLERHALFQQVGDGRHPEGVRRQAHGRVLGLEG